MAFVPLNTNNSNLANYNSVNSLMLDYQGFKKQANGNFADGWISGVLPTVSSVTNNGNRSYDITFSGDVSSYLSPGMRLKTIRTVSAPTQCTSLNGTNQYWSKTGTITGLSTGTTWTFKFKAKINSYKTQVIASFDDGSTNILQLYLNSSGQIVVTGGTYASQDSATSNASHPLNKWFEVTGSLTIGSSPSAEITMDGVVIPSTVTNGAVTTFTAASTTFYIGRNALGSYIDGKIAQVAVFNAIISASTLRGYSSQTQTGAETNCIGFWSFNGNGNDSSANANNLTAQNSATATNADSPFAVNGSGTATGTDDYAIIQKVSTTVATVSVPAGCTIPTSGGIASTYISTVKNPFNWVSDNTKWSVDLIHKIQASQGGAVAGTWYNLGSVQITIPVGFYSVSYQVGIQQNGTASAADVRSTFGISSSAATDNDMTSYISISSANIGGMATKIKDYTFTSATLHYLLVGCATALASNTVFLRSDTTPTIIRAVPSGL